MRVRRPQLSVSARLVLAVVIPTLALSIVGLGVVVQRNRDARTATEVRDGIVVVGQLAELRAALFAERIAAELLVPDRRPPEEVLATTDFGRQILVGFGPLEALTDAALARLDPADRPFGPQELERIRADRDEWSRSPDTIRARLGPLTTRTEQQMLADASSSRDDSLALADRDLISAGTTFNRSIGLPNAAGGIVGSLSDLWSAPPEDRSMLQSDVAERMARYTTLVERFDESLVGTDPASAELWVDRLKVPSSIQRMLDEVGQGSLSSPERPAGEPLTVGLVLLEAIDWTIAIEAIPVQAAESMIAAADATAADARANEVTTAVLVLIVVVISVVGALLFGRSIVAPVRRLTGHAQRLGRGELTLDPLPLDGPPDVAKASVALNDVVVTLRVLEQTSQALADVELDHPALSEPLPGELGAALQRSTEVLSTSIAEREHLQARLAHDASHDSLTGLANRAALMERIAAAEADATPGAAIFLDLDGFKRVNDRLGHRGGDAVLQVVAERIEALAPTGSTVARLGGDEFVVHLPGASLAEATQRARSMTIAVGEPIHVAGGGTQVQACAGVAAGDGGASPLAGPSDLLLRADLAVYEAKQQGGGAVVAYDADFGRRIAGQQDVESALGATLDAGGDGLRLVYQPIVAARTERLVAVESLVRWDRDGTTVAPDDFVPIAERSGLIVALDLWVLRAAAAQMAVWRGVPELAEVAVSVNLSGLTLLRPELPEEIDRALRDHDVEPGRLVLEVTETALITDVPLAAAQLEHIRSRGVRVAIDDFGTGYTSIAQLRALPVDELKIDGSYVRRLPGPSDQVLLQIVEDLAEHLHLSTVAEGVETAAQAEHLAAIGCDALQGYHFSRPLPPEALVAWARGRAQA